MAFLQGSCDGLLEFVDVQRFGEDVMSAARALQCADLLADFQGARDDDDRDEGEEFFKLRQEVQAKFAIGQNVVENQ